MNLRKMLILLIVCLLSTQAHAASLFLKDNLRRAQVGDFIVVSQKKTYTLLLIKDKTPETLTVEEISVPSDCISRQQYSWRDWVAKNAPSHTAWIRYTISLETFDLLNSYALSKSGWYAMTCKDIFLPTLLNLRLKDIPKKQRKRVGPPPDDGSPDFRPFWQPVMMVDGKPIPKVNFSAWSTRWPNDEGPLSDKYIEIYLPEESDKYPAYFPYWLQIRGNIGQAQLRIVDSGKYLTSPTTLNMFQNMPPSTSN